MTTIYDQTLAQIQTIHPAKITLTLPEVAKILSVKEGSIRSACSRGQLPFPIVRIMGLPILVRVDDLARAMCDLPQAQHEYATPRKGRPKPSWAARCFTVHFLNEHYKRLDKSIHEEHEKLVQAVESVLDGDYPQGIRKSL